VTFAPSGEAEYEKLLPWLSPAVEYYGDMGAVSDLPGVQNQQYFIVPARAREAEAVGEVALEKAKRLRRWLKDRFPGDPVAAKDLCRFEGESIRHASWLARLYRARFAVIFARASKPWTIGKWGFR
jgi:hypothetical protein